MQPHHLLRAFDRRDQVFRPAQIVSAELVQSVQRPSLDFRHASDNSTS